MGGGSPGDVDIRPASDSALRVCFGDAIGPTAGKLVRRLLGRLDATPPADLVDVSPAYASLLLRFDPRRFEPGAAMAHVRALLAGLGDEPLPPARLVTIPVRYGGPDGPDLEAVARLAGLAPAEVVRLHSGTTYEVSFLGFTPGFAYMGTVPEAIAAPRLDRPRPLVPAGSVGIAGSQTGVYPCPTPGGWRLIGRTSKRLFDPARDPMALLRIGDQVRFAPEGDADAQ